MNYPDFNYRCPGCGSSLYLKEGNDLRLECPQCLTAHPMYLVDTSRIIDFMQLSSKMVCNCNRDGLTTCNIELAKELETLTAKGEVRGTRFIRKYINSMNLKNRCLKILDVGCAQAPYGDCLSEGNTVCGLDSCPRRLLLGEKNVVGSGYKELLLADALQIPLYDDQFDLVICTELIEHVLEVRTLLKELNRVLKTGGRLLVTTPNLVSVWNRMSIIFGSGRGFTPWGILKGEGVYNRFFSIQYPDQTLHLRFFTFDSLKRLMAESGFKVLNTTGYDPVLCRIPPLNRIFKTFCQNIVMECAKVKGLYNNVR